VPIAQSSAIPKDERNGLRLLALIGAYGWCGRLTSCGFACLRLLNDLSICPRRTSPGSEKTSDRLSKPFAWSRLRLATRRSKWPSPSGIDRGSYHPRGMLGATTDGVNGSLSARTAFSSMWARTSIPLATHCARNPENSCHSFEPHRKFSASLPQHQPKRTQN